MIDHFPLCDVRAMMLVGNLVLFVKEWTWIIAMQVLIFAFAHVLGMEMFNGNIFHFGTASRSVVPSQSKAAIRIFHCR